MTDFPIVIFHNPVCGTSRNTVAMVEATGYAPTVVEYLQAGWTHDQLRELDAMVEHPILVNRPIVVTPKGVKLCRPSEAVLDLLDRKPASFTKEDGEVVKL
jgi:arsenate reductase